VGVSRDSPNFSEHSVSYRGHRAVTFAIAWLSCDFEYRRELFSTVDNSR